MISVSIAEDLPEIRTTLESLISSQPDMLLLSSSTSGEEAAVSILQSQPDVAIMDVNMPGINGIECIKKIAADCPHTQFMIFTIYENDEKIFEALAAGASGYMLKKTPAEKMIEAIKDLHHGGSPMSSMVARKVLGHFKQDKSTGLDVLTNKENEILGLLAKGYLYKEIAAKLFITTGTVTQHIHKIYDKLHVSNRTEAINKLQGS